MSVVVVVVVVVYDIPYSESGRVSHYIITKRGDQYHIGNQVFSDLLSILDFYKTHYLDTTYLTSVVRYLGYALAYELIQSHLVSARTELVHCPCGADSCHQSSCPTDSQLHSKSVLRQFDVNHGTRADTAPGGDPHGDKSSLPLLQR